MVNSVCWHSALLPFLKAQNALQSNSHTDGCSAAKHCNHVTIRSDLRLSVLTKDTVTHECAGQELNLWFFQLEMTTLPLHHRHRSLTCEREGH